MRSASPRTVLFDVDGTLHDREAGVRAFLRDQHKTLELETKGVPLERWTERFLALEERGRVWKDEVYGALARELDLTLRPEDLLEAYVREFVRYVVPFDGLLECLMDLRDMGWRTGLVTNGRSAFQRATLGALRIESLLDTIVISEEIGVRKPKREIFDEALRRLDCQASRAWFIGDDLVADVAGATSAGMRALLFRPGAETRSVFEERAINRLRDIPSLVSANQPCPTSLQ